MSIRTAKYVTLAGGTAVLISFFLLPWVHFLESAEAERQVVQFITDTRIREIMGRVPQLRQALGIRQLATAEDVRELFTAPEIKELFEVARHRTQLSGYALWRETPGVNEWLRWSLLLAVVIAVATLFWSMFQLTAPPSAVLRQGAVIGAAIAVVVLLMLIWHVPSLAMLGSPDDMGIALVCVLTGSRVGGGIWVALLGLAAIIAGGLVELLLDEENETGATGAYE